MSEPDPITLWTQANGDRDEYLRLMREHGHIVLVKRPAGEDVFGHRMRTECAVHERLDCIICYPELRRDPMSDNRGNHLGT